MGRIIAAAGLEKIARHLALLTLVAVIFKSCGWTRTGQVAIGCLAAIACILHLAAKWLKAKAPVLRHDR